MKDKAIKSKTAAARAESPLHLVEKHGTGIVVPFPTPLARGGSKGCPFPADHFSAHESAAEIYSLPPSFNDDDAHLFLTMMCKLSRTAYEYVMETILEPQP